MSEWERQKREINSYNVFFSAISGSHETDGFASRGFGLVDPFVTIPRSENVEPDFALCSDDTLLLVEVKSGGNINVPEHSNQMERFQDVGLEAGEAFLSEAGVDRDITRVDNCIVYSSETLRKCREEWDSCPDDLGQVQNFTPVLGQSKGGTLQIDSGQAFEDPRLQEILEDGMNLPQAPQRNIYLSENAEKESVAVSICHDIVLNNLVGRFSLTPIQVRNFYGQHPNLTIERIERTLQYLSHIGACDSKEDTGEYIFSTYHEDEIISIEKRVRDERVGETLSDLDDDQMGLRDVDYSRYEATDSDTEQ